MFDGAHMEGVSRDSVMSSPGSLGEASGTRHTHGVYSYAVLAMVGDLDETKRSRPRLLAGRFVNDVAFGQRAELMRTVLSNSALQFPCHRASD